MGETILVLEDDGDIRAVLADLLRDAGFVAMEAEHNGHLPEASGVGLVLTDLPKTLQGYSPHEARKWVAAARERYRAPVIVVTAHGEASTDEQLTAMAAAIIAKPFELDDLLQRVTEVVRAG